MTHRIPYSVAILALMAALVLLVASPVPPAESAALALAVAAIGLWATGAIPEHVTALGFFTVAMLFKVAPAGVTFAGFESAALWLIFGGLVMGVAVRTTGLGERIAQYLAPAFGNSYAGVITGVTTVGVVLGFVMPSSMGRAVLLMPIALSIADGFGFETGSRGRLGVVLAAAFGCHVPTFSILPANVPNLVLVGAAETMWQASFTYGRYLWLHFPVLGLLKTAAMVLLIVKIWPDRPSPNVAKRLGPMSGQEKWLALVIAGCLIMWATDFIHHISPAWVSTSAAVLLLMPRIGLVPRKAFNEQINFASMFYCAGIIGLGSMVNWSGLGARLAGFILHLLPLSPGDAVANFAGLATVSTLVGLGTTLPGVPAVLTPLAGEMAKASGLSLDVILNSQVLGFSNPILAYESAPLVVAMQLGGERLGPAQWLCILLAIITVAVLMPLNFFWWRLLGMI